MRHDERENRRRSVRGLPLKGGRVRACRKDLGDEHKGRKVKKRDRKKVPRPRKEKIKYLKKKGPGSEITLRTKDLGTKEKEYALTNAMERRRRMDASGGALRLKGTHEKRKG